MSYKALIVRPVFKFGLFGLDSDSPNDVKHNKEIPLLEEKDGDPFNDWFWISQRVTQTEQTWDFKLLKQINDPPVVLYIKGTLLKEDSLAVAIVGSRRCSTYGSEQASRFSHLLASSGFTILSGMARGIDTAVHQGTLSANGRTIAVQGTGLAKIFPSENISIYRLT